MSDRIKYGKILITGIILTILMVIVLILGKIFTVKEIKIIGNNFYTQEEIKEKIFSSSLEKNTLFIWLSYHIQKQKEIPFIERYQIDLVSPSELKVTVYEKNIIGYINYMGSKMYFDRDGTVLESSQEVMEGIPQIKGISFEHIVLYDKLETKQKGLLSSIFDLVQLFEQYEMDVDTIYYDEEGNASIILDDIVVELGDNKFLDGKIAELRDIFPNLTGLKGTLYLNTYTEDATSSSYIFKKSEK